MNRSAKAHVASDQASIPRGHHGGLLGMVVLLAAVCGIFGPALATSQVFVFRDAAHFYYPLFQWTADQWRQGQIPLWNPLEDLGSPVIADATSSVFYPGKILLLLPGAFGFWYKAYIVAHVLMCGFTSFRLARHWQAQASAATLAALSYALGGHVLFQYCNVVYLVGAAWLPAAIQCGDRLVSEGGVRNVAALATSLSMMVFGGDAQLAYHTGMMLVGLLWLSRRSRKSRESRRLTNRGIQLIAAAGLAIGLSAVQWLPTTGWLGSSTRASYDAPRNIYEFARYPFETESRPGFHKTLLGQSQPGHYARVVDFSVGPWRAIELLWPNAGGALFPHNRRWMNAIPAEGRVWTPTLYLGLLPVLLASLSFRLRGGTVRRRFLSWCGLLSALAALGGYGLGWLLSEIHYGFGGDGQLPVGDPFGGLYWLFTIVLPGYVYFRYPAKLWVITSLVVSQLAAISFGRAVHVPNNIAKRLSWRMGLLVASTLALGAIIGLVPLDWSAWLAAAPADELLGPLDVASVRPQLLVSLGHTLLLTSTLGAVLFLFRSTLRVSPSSRTWKAWLVVIITATELVVAQRDLVPLAPADAMTRPRSPTLAHTFTATVPIRFYRGLDSWYPAWPQDSDRRLEQCLRWNNATLFPKHHLLHDLAVVGTRHSTKSVYQHALFTAVLKATQTPSLPVQFLRDLGVTYQIAPAVAGGGPQPREPGRWRDSELLSTNEPDSVHVYHDNDGWVNRVWIVRNIESVPPANPRNRAVLAAFCNHIVQPSPASGLRDLQNSAVVESVTTPNPPAWDVVVPLKTQLRSIDDHATITGYSATRVDLSARLAAPGLVVLNDTYAEGWKCYVTFDGNATPQRVPIHRTNAIMRSVYLPAGEFQIQMRYQPSDFFVGAAISVILWMACLLYLVIHFGFHIVRCFGAHT